MTSTVDEITTEEIVYQPESNSPTENTMIAQGTLEEWKANVVAPLIGHPYPLTFLAAAFAGPLLRFAHIGSFGLHLFGRSSSGKTTSLQVAASVWGCGAKPNDSPSKAFIRGWYSTANAMEGLCAAHMDCLMVLDELQMCEANKFGDLVYSIFGGQGKSRMNTNAQLKAQRQWRIVSISSGELSSVQKIKESGESLKAGQQVRFMDLPIVGSILSNAQAADSINSACSNFYGVAGPEFIAQLVREYVSLDTIQSELKIALDAAVRSMPECQSQEQARGLKHLALVKVAANLACALLDLPVKPEEFNSAIDFVAKAWLNNTADLPDIERGVIAVRDFILKHRDSRFRIIPVDIRLQIPNLVGYWNQSAKFYGLTDDGLREACKGFDHVDIAKELKRRGFLKFEADRLKIKIRYKLAEDINSDESLRVYAVKESIHSSENPD